MTHVPDILVVLLILALWVGFYAYCADDLAERIAHERTLDQMWDDVTEAGEGERYAEGPDRRELAPRPTPVSVTSSTVGRRAGRPIPRTAGTPYDWAADESFGDAAA